MRGRCESAQAESVTPEPLTIVFTQQTGLSLRFIVVTVVNRAPFKRVFRPRNGLVPPALVVKEVEHADKTAPASFQLPTGRRSSR